MNNRNNKSNRTDRNNRTTRKKHLKKQEKFKTNFSDAKLIKLLSGYSNKSICIISANAAKLAKRRNRADISVNDYIESIKISAQEKPDKRDYLPDSRKNQSIGFKFT